MPGAQQHQQQQPPTWQPQQPYGYGVPAGGHSQQAGGGYPYSPHQAPVSAYYNNNGYASATSYGGAPSYQQQQQPASPIMMAPPPLPVAVSSAPDVDFYKGFHDGVVQGARGSYFGTAMSWIGPLCVNLVLFLGPLWYLRRRYLAQMGVTGADASKKGMSSMMEMMMPLKPKQYRVEIKGTSFKDVIGVPEAKEELKQYVDFLSDPDRFTRLGARLPRGCLLTGSPGTGKTLIAKAVAGEAGKPFFTCSGADFIEVFGGSGPKRVRELFAEAREAAPCVVFIDEIDAIGSRGNGRGMSGGGGGSSEENSTINQLLAELDGLQSSKAIVVIAATNFPDNIDKALLRDGRFDRKVNIPMPDMEARVDLFEYYLNKIVTGDPNCKPKPMTILTKRGEGDSSKNEYATEPVPVEIVPGVENKKLAHSLAERTPGTSPAQISAIVNEAALAAAMKDEKVVTLPYVQDAIDDVLIGKKHRQRMGDASLRRTAVHECGHAIMAWFSPMQKDVIKVSIIPRGRAGGYTQQVQDEAMDPKTNDFLFSQLCVLLGGRVAERVALGDISKGDVADLQRATKIAMDQLLSYGMGKEIGQLAFRSQGDKSNGRSWFNYSEDLHSRVETEAKVLVQKAYNETVRVLTEKKPLLQRMSDTLLEKKEIMRDDITAILGDRVVATAKIATPTSTKVAA